MEKKISYSEKLSSLRREMIDTIRDIVTPKIENTDKDITFLYMLESNVWENPTSEDNYNINSITWDDDEDAADTLLVHMGNNDIACSLLAMSNEDLAMMADALKNGDYVC